MVSNNQSQTNNHEDINMTLFQFVGVDVSKDKFDSSFNDDSKVFTLDNKGFKKFVQYLNKVTSTPWVCMEATGHYSELLAEYLYKNKIQVSIINPLQIKSFAKSKLVRNKNDQLDAKVIAHYGEVMQPRPFNPRSEDQKEIRDLVKLLDKLKEQLVQLKNQLSSTQGKLTKKLIKQSIASIEKDIKKVLEEIKRLAKENPEFSTNVDLLSSIKGIAELTSFKLLSIVPNVSQFKNAKQFAAFIGLTPQQRQSGKYQGKTVLCKTGHASLRKVLYMCALVARRFNPVLKQFADNLASRGKAPKQVLCAVMRKMAHIVFGVLKNQEKFNPAYG